MVVIVNFCQLLQGVQMVLEVLCCPGSRYKHAVREDTALQLSENKTKNTEVHFLCTWKDMKWIIYKFTCVDFKLNSKKYNVMLVTCHLGIKCWTPI